MDKRFNDIRITMFPENALVENTTFASNHYFYSTLKNKKKNTDSKTIHVYKLAPHHPNDRNVTVELTSCLGELEVQLKEYKLHFHDLKNLVTDKDYNIKFDKFHHYGKQIITFNFPKNIKEAILVVYNKEDDLDKLCSNNMLAKENECENSYSIKYRTESSGDEQELYQIDNIGYPFQPIKDEKASKLTIDLGSVYTRKTKKKVEAYFFVNIYEGGEDEQSNFMIPFCVTKKPIKQFYKKSIMNEDKNIIEVDLSELDKNKDYIIQAMSRTDDLSHTILNHYPAVVKGEKKSNSSTIIIGNLL
jgi:hypothetical protein